MRDDSEHSSVKSKSDMVEEKIVRRDEDEDEEELSEYEEQAKGDDESNKKLYERRLGQLAWLLEGGSVCAAVAVMENKFVIASNDFFEGTRPNNQKLKLTCEIMAYFKEIAVSGKLNVDERDKLMKKIAEARMSVETKGMVRIDKDSINTKNFSNSLDGKLPDLKGKDSKYKHTFIPKYFKSMGFGFEIFRRIVKIEKFITDNITSNLNHEKNCPHEKIIDAFKNFVHKDSKDSKKASINSNILFCEEKEGVHAELQILRYFLQNKSEKDSIYIGISKLCCFDCISMLDCANEVLKEEGKEELIKVRGSHNIRFEKWIAPSAMLKNDIKESLLDKIYSTYKDKVKNSKPKEKKDGYTMVGTLSESEAYIEGIEVDQYKSRLENDISVLKKYCPETDENLKMLKLGVKLCSIETFQELFEKEDEILEDKTCEKK